MEQNEKKPLIILTGPTAVGKTELSIELAKAVNGEILSADSMQVYRGMDIGTAKIKKEEMQGIPHYMIDELDPDEEFNVYIFQEKIRRYMTDIYDRGKIPILTGGTGFYIQAVVRDIDFTENEASPYRAELEALAEEKGSTWLHEELRKVDPESAEAIHENNVKRVIRALEFYRLTGKKISEHNEEQKERQSPYHFAYFVLNDEREHLYRRIEQRIDQMLEQGLVDEVKKLKSMGCHQDMVSMKGLGYKEILDYLDGITTLPEAVEILKRDTRHFAKRQITWFKRERDVIWVDKDAFEYDEEKILQYMLAVLQERHVWNH